MITSPTLKFREWAVQHGTPWEVTFPKEGALPRKRRFYATEDEAKKAIKDHESGRQPAAAIGKRALDELTYCRALLPKDVTLLEAVRYYVANHTQESTLTLKDVTDRFLGRLKAEQKSDDYRAEQERMVGIALKELGAATVFSSIKKARWLQFIAADSESYWNRYARKRLASILIQTGLQMEAVRVNPLAGFKFESQKRRTPHFLKVWEVHAILAYVQEKRPELVPAFALQFFLGVRTEELCRAETATKRPLKWEDITFGKRVHVAVEVSKTNAARNIQFWPKALTKWLETAKESKGVVCPVNELDTVKSKLLVAMNRERKEKNQKLVDFRQNDFRRTCASYLVALLGDAGKVQVILGHERNSSMLFKNYDGLATREDAEVFFEETADNPLAAQKVA